MTPKFLFPKRLGSGDVVSPTYLPLQLCGHTRLLLYKKSPEIFPCLRTPETEPKSYESTTDDTDYSNFMVLTPLRFTRLLLSSPLVSGFPVDFFAIPSKN